MRAVEVVITGRVQGVGYRWSCAAEAERLGVYGWVRNRVDGTVEGHFEGDAASVEALMAWCRRGPRSARVDRVVVNDVALSGDNDFTVFS